jgi:hypothetical protein
MRATEFLIERISSRVFHYTRVTTALKILQSGQFELSHTLGTSWEAQFAPKGYPYFLSTTRTRHGGYHGYLGQDAVLFELDGDFYNQRYPGKAIDYWNNRDPMKDHHKAHEAEDRIFSRENAIPAAIKVIDLYIAPDADEAARARTRQVIILAKKAGIPVNLFNDQAAWRQRDTRKLAGVSQLRGQDPARGYVERRRGGYLKPWMELMQAKTKAQLSKDADRKRYDLQYTYDKQGLAKSLAVDLSNARKPGPDADRNNAIRIIKFMQQNNLATVDDFVNSLADKWKNIKEGVAEAFDQPYRLKWYPGDMDEVTVYAEIPNGDDLNIMFNLDANEEGEEAWSVEFYRNNSQQVTGEGDAQRIFATVLSAIQTFIKKYKPKRVVFSASKEVEPGQKSQSRANLYDRLVQRYARALGFKAFRADAGNKVHYELNRINKGVAEGVMSDLDQDRQDANWDAIVGYVINGLKKNQDVGHMELALYKWGGKELVDVDQELEDRGFKDLADLASHIQQHGGQYQPPTNFGLDGLGRGVAENFADGKVKGRSRPGRVERSGASCNGSVTDLRAKAKKYGGEKGKMYHWCANMKSGRSKD